MTQIEFAYETSKKVFAGELTQQDAAKCLHAEHGINVNSAKIMIAVYGKMVRGLEFKRALSARDMNYYLARFLADGGPSGLRNPVNALLMHIVYYENRNNVTLNSLREIHTTYSALNNGIKNTDTIQDDFLKSVEEAKELSDEERKRRLLASPKQPRTRPVMVITYERNPYVVVEVLKRAQGVCEACKSTAPFRRKKDDTPYLEVHHKIRLADGGFDTVDNAIALCPNCHRKFHFGRDET